MKNEIRPYPYPQDIEGLLVGWSRKTGYRIPEVKPYQQQLYEAVKSVFPTADLIPEKDMLATAREAIKMCSREGLACISIDNVYMPQISSKIPNYLDITRLVDESLQPIGLGQRNTTSGELRYQLERLAKVIGNKPTIIYDDVAWEGTTMSLVIDLAREAGINLQQVVVAIGIGEALEVIQNKGLQCRATFYYPVIVDTVSERDFKVGAPSSGRTIQSNGRAMGAPYVKPLGNVEGWATMPKESVDDFSQWVLTVARDFWLQAEKLSEEKIPTWSLDKPPFLLPSNFSTSAAILEVIEKF